MDEVDPEDHHGRGDGRPDEHVEIQQDGQGDAGNDAVDEGVTEEGHAPNDHPGADECQRNGRQRPADEGALLEGELEWCGQPVHAVTTLLRG